MPAAIHVQLGGALIDRGPADLDTDHFRRLIVRAARAVLRRERVVEADISITFLDDAAIADLNRQYLAHDGPTDVISFPLYVPGEPPVGDIYIGYDQAVRQAAADAIATDEELVRLAVHGTLHVLGYDHASGDDRTDSPMWMLQEEIVTGVMSE